MFGVQVFVVGAPAKTCADRGALSQYKATPTPRVFSVCGGVVSVCGVSNVT